MSLPDSDAVLAEPWVDSYCATNRGALVLGGVLRRSKYGWRGFGDGEPFERWERGGRGADGGTATARALSRAGVLSVELDAEDGGGGLEDAADSARTEALAVSMN